jgi:hypothetical protein
MFSLLHQGKQRAASLSIRNEGGVQLQERAARFNHGKNPGDIDGTIDEEPS